MNQPPTDLSQAIFFVSLVVLTLTFSLIFTILYHKRRTNIFPKPYLNHNNPPGKIYKILSVELSDSNNFSPLISQLETRHQLLRCKTFSEAKISIRKQPIDFILATFCNQLKNSTDKFSRFNRQFPAIPIIIQQNSSSFINNKLPENCFSYYVTNEINTGKFDIFLEENIVDKIYITNFSDYGIDGKKCSPFIQKALKVLEEKFTEIKSVNKLANELDVSRELLSREFTKQCSIKLKKLITMIKLHHAIFLMQNPGLNLNEISAIVGFSNMNHFRLCFQRYLGSGPKTYRTNLIINMNQV